MAVAESRTVRQQHPGGEQKAEGQPNPFHCPNLHLHGPVVSAVI
jgi:hypothetical protein